MPGPRYLILGTSGSGKTTLARCISAKLNLRHIELDAIRHGPNWTELPDPAFRDAVRNAAMAEQWVIDGNYGIVRDIVIARATQIIWLDLPRSVVMGQVLRRSLARVLLRQTLWNGNRETLSSLFRSDHPIRWTWATHNGRRREFELRVSENWIRLQSRNQIAQWIRSLRA